MLKARKIVKRREIQEDTLSIYYKRITNFFKGNSNYLQIAFAAIILILVVTLLMARSKRQAELTASSQLGIGENYFYQKQYPNAITDLESISASFPGTRAAGKAIYYLAVIYLNQKDFQRAEEYFKNYLKAYKNDPLYKAASMAGIAACWENKEQYDEAAGWYINAWRADKSLPVAAFYLNQAAMNYALAGNSASAKDTYQLLIDEYPESSLVNKASYLIEML